MPSLSSCGMRWRNIPSGSAASYTETNVQAPCIDKDLPGEVLKLSCNLHGRWACYANFPRTLRRILQRSRHQRTHCRTTVICTGEEMRQHEYALGDSAMCRVYYVAVIEDFPTCKWRGKKERFVRTVGKNDFVGWPERSDASVPRMDQRPLHIMMSAEGHRLIPRTDTVLIYDAAVEKARVKISNISTMRLVLRLVASSIYVLKERWRGKSSTAARKNGRAFWNNVDLELLTTERPQELAYREWRITVTRSFFMCGPTTQLSILSYAGLRWQFKW
jgi:hypothetical protein